MTSHPAYRDYVEDTTFLNRYSDYQDRYVVEPRESDKRLIQLVSQHLESCPERDDPRSLLDMGCSTGNLLLHIRAALPELKLTGGDAAVSAIEECQANKVLGDIDFKVMDMLNLGNEDRFDIIIANAVTYLFEEDQYERAMAGVHNALHSGGIFLSFEWVHPYRQDIKIIEKSDSHPNGLPIHSRSYRTVSRIASACGFESVVVSPFEIPIDLGEENKTADADSFESLNTRTVKTESGERMLFRGALYQPWCHVSAKKAA